MPKFPMFTALPLAAMILSSSARADGDVRCDSGPRSGWKPIAELHEQVAQEGWTIRKAHPEGDCFEVYARTATGQAVEAFFHPVTLRKLVVYQRGKEVFRASGFTPR